MANYSDKITTPKQMQKALLKVFEQSGGIYRLVELCKKDDTQFTKLVDKIHALIPKETYNKTDNHIQVTMNIPRPPKLEPKPKVIDAEVVATDEPLLEQESGKKEST